KHDVFVQSGSKTRMSVGRPLGFDAFESSSFSSQRQWNRLAYTGHTVAHASARAARSTDAAFELTSMAKYVRPSIPTSMYQSDAVDTCARTALMKSSTAGGPSGGGAVARGVASKWPERCPVSRPASTLQCPS